MLNKSIRLTREDVVGLNEIITHDLRIEKGQSEALYYCFKDAATNIPDWSLVAKSKFGTDKEGEITPEEGGSIIRTFNIEEEDFHKVRKSINDQLNLSRPRVSYMTRLCILAARMRLEKDKNIDKNRVDEKVESVPIDGVSLIKKIAELLESTSVIAQRKILRIKQIVEE